MNQLKKLFYFLIIWIISCSSAVIYVARNNWFGKDDILVFAKTTLVFSLSSLLLFNLFKKIFSRFSLIISVSLVLFISILQSIIFTLIIYVLIGPWIYAYSFPIITCWLLGTLSGNIYILILSNKQFKIKYLLAFLGSVTVVFLSTILYNKIKDVASKDQNFDIICLTWTPSQTVPKVSDLTKYSLTESEAKAIINLGLKGTFWADKFFRVKNSKFISTDNPTHDFDSSKENEASGMEFQFGNTLDSIVDSNPKAVVIMNHPQESDFAFKQPIDQSLIIYQLPNRDEFKIVQFGKELNEKTITIETNSRQIPPATSLLVQLKNRKDFSLYGFGWMGE